MELQINQLNISSFEQHTFLINETRGIDVRSFSLTEKTKTGVT